ncbi:MAG: DsrS [Gammaproteobacteria bacterium]|nr:DsrS [Gammaproteobacteria bacterium]
MPLSQEDSLRLNVLLNQSVHAIRIDEGKMMVYGLTARGEAKIQLNPNCRDENYVRHVKEMISSHVLGSPGGYPIFLKRWTRMGQARAENLASLLKLGEPEAVVAVVGAAALTDELARCAWWAMPDADNARRMLAREDVATGTMGKILAEFLLEFLPFEEEPRNIIESVRLVLQPGLVSTEAQAQLWSRGQRKNAYWVGFLKSLPDQLPTRTRAHPNWERWQRPLAVDDLRDNPLAVHLLRLLSPRGQAYLHTVTTVLDKPVNQDVVVATFDTLEQYFHTVRPHQEKRRELSQILAEADLFCAAGQDCCQREAIAQLKARLPELHPIIESVLVVACVGEPLIAPVFALTDAVGTVMRRKIEPIVAPVLLHLRRLQGQVS